MKRPRPCWVGTFVLAELAADMAQRRYDRTRSHAALLALVRARAAACRAWRRR